MSAGAALCPSPTEECPAGPDNASGRCIPSGHDAEDRSAFETILLSKSWATRRTSAQRSLTGPQQAGQTARRLAAGAFGGGRSAQHRRLHRWRDHIVFRRPAHRPAPAGGHFCGAVPTSQICRPPNCAANVLAAKKRPRDKKIYSTPSHWQAASAASIQSSHFCRNHPARSPVYRQTA